MKPAIFPAVMPRTSYHCNLVLYVRSFTMNRFYITGVTQLFVQNSSSGRDKVWGSQTGSYRQQQFLQAVGEDSSDKTIGENQPPPQNIHCSKDLLNHSDLAILSVSITTCFSQALRDPPHTHTHRLVNHNFGWMPWRSMEDIKNQF